MRYDRSLEWDIIRLGGQGRGPGCGPRTLGVFPLKETTDGAKDEYVQSADGLALVEGGDVANHTSVNLEGAKGEVERLIASGYAEDQ